MNVISARKNSLKFNLVQHFRIHLGENPYGCAKSGKWFTAHSNPSRQIRTYRKELSRD